MKLGELVGAVAVLALSVLLSSTSMSAAQLPSNGAAGGPNDVAGAYAVTRTVTQSTCPGVRPGDVNAMVWLLDHGQAGWHFSVLGDTGFRDFTGMSQAGVLTITARGRGFGQQMTVTLRSVAGGLEGTETVTSTGARGRPCSVIRQVHAVRLSR